MHQISQYPAYLILFFLEQNNSFLDLFVALLNTIHDPLQDSLTCRKTKKHIRKRSQNLSLILVEISLTSQISTICEVPRHKHLSCFNSQYKPLVAAELIKHDMLQPASKYQFLFSQMVSSNFYLTAVQQFSQEIICHNGICGLIQITDTILQISLTLNQTLFAKFVLRSSSNCCESFSFCSHVCVFATWRSFTRSYSHGNKNKNITITTTPRCQKDQVW